MADHKITSAEHRKLKQTIIKSEPNNRRFIYVIPCGGGKGWYEMAEQSAIYYKYLVGEKIGCEINLNKDLDTFTEPYKIGFVRLQNPKRLENRMRRAGVFEAASEKNGVLIFQMKEALTDKQARALVNRELSFQAAANTIVPIGITEPTLYADLLLLIGRMFQACDRQMNDFARKIYGEDLVRTCNEIMEQYLMFTQNVESQTKAKKLHIWTKMITSVEKLERILRLVEISNVWNRKKYTSMEKQVLDLKKRIESQRETERTKDCEVKK